MELEADAALADPARGELELFVPAWTPGSYLIREYARHLHLEEALDAVSGQRLAVRRTAKNRFSIAVPEGCRRLRIRYRVLAHELSVRTSHLDAGHAYWNGACLALWPVGRSEMPCTIQVLVPAGWELATPLAAAFADGDGQWFSASGLDEFVDSPVLAGALRTLSWEWRGVPHSMVLEGLEAVPVPEHLLADVRAVTEEAAAVFGGALPYPRYQFLAMFSDKGRGGLEHRDCSTLLAPRTALRPGRTYRDFLALVAHEFFHVWNVKRMRPAELWDIDYEVENHTSLLWVAEGFTAYYDELLCRRAGILSEADYLALLGEHIADALRNPGRYVQSLSEASFDAWIRLYRPDADTRNTTQNYYVNGALAAMCLDLSIRRASSGARSLDDAMRSLYEATYGAGRGYDRGDLEAALEEAAGEDLRPLVAKLVDGPFDPDFDEVLSWAGLRLQRRERDKPYLGVSFRADQTVLAQVAEGSPAGEAGLAPGDEVLAIENLRVTARTWEAVFASLACPGRALRVLRSRRGVVEPVEVVPSTQPVGALEVAVDPKAGASQQALREDWLRSRRALAERSA